MTRLQDLVFYFLRLGSVVFGGPVVLAAHMQRVLVEERRWISQEDFEQGFTLAQLAPGPLATQLAMYIGWLKAGRWGAALVGFAFVLPSFLMVLLIAMFYVSCHGLPWLEGAFYGIGAAVIALMLLGAYKLLKKTVGKDFFLGAIAASSLLVTAITESEIIWLFLLSGVGAVLYKGKYLRRTYSFSLLLPSVLVSGIKGEVYDEGFFKLLLFFTKAGAFVFGSGLAIVPFLHSGVVVEQQWLSERQFLDAVAVAMISPGPVVITVAFIGYLIAGLSGAIIASIGIFLPSYLLVVLSAPYYRKFSHSVLLKHFTQGVTAAAVGAIGGAALVLGKKAIIDLPTSAIFIVVLIMLLFFKKIPEPILIILAGVLGHVLRSLSSNL